MGVLSDLMGGGKSGGGDSPIGKIGSALKRKKKDRPAVVTGGGGAGDNSYGDAGVPELRRGGKIKRGGMVKLHAGEQVLTAKETKRYKARGKKR